MPNLIIIRKNEGGSQATFTVGYVQVRGTDDVDQILAGKTLADLPQDHVIANGNIRYPSGERSQPHDLGSPAISDWIEALAVARAARENSESEIRQLGFSESTPIYVWQGGKVTLWQDEST